jgi:hypothetical protein
MEYFKELNLKFLNKKIGQTEIFKSLNLKFLN